MVQRQVQLRTTVFKQKGMSQRDWEGETQATSYNVTSTTEDHRYSKQRITSNSILFSALLNGVNFKQQAGALRWYEGHVTSYKGQLYLHYDETDENWVFS